ncbi:hypothetical protein IWW36_002172 [Coemansia brasiliensis]|uniref:Uncharacterized protein n=1 Tax=Coemansia brasiliensis TaxID=2650707 RepID=A0A9W8I8F4_9FUNG|nr:hypothetical protein IWW36_002172 [Coemansia brasiliensis]
MVELWSQQAVDSSAVLVTIATLASFKQNSLWTQKRYWIQTNMAPVFGIIVFLPLVNTIVTQIVWRFRSSEFVYCWVPRMPIYARWIAVDGWRLLAVAGIISTYLYLGFSIRAIKRKQRHSLSLLQPANSYSSSTCSPAGLPSQMPMNLSEIDSGPASRVTADNRGLFSQSIYNIQFWARSKLGRSIHATDTANAGLRGRLLPHRLGRSVPPTHSSDGDKYVTDDAPHGSLLVPKHPRGYYEQFKRSLASLVRWFAITIDIPSPTISPSIFDTIDSNYVNAQQELIASHDIMSSTTRCELCASQSILPPASHGLSDSYRTSDLHVNQIHCYNRRSSFTSSIQYFDSLPGISGGLRRWCSAITRLASKPSLSTVSWLSPHRKLRRSHTTPAMPRGQMDLCNCVFKRPQHVIEMTPYDHPTLAPSLSKCTDEMQLGDNTKIHEIFGFPIQSAPAPVLQPRHVSIYTCANTHINEDPISQTYSSSGSSSLTDNRESKLYGESSWSAAVAQCRSARAAAKICSTKPYRISRLYVYPLAYILVWLPSIIYYIVSSHAFYASFHSMSLTKRTIDMNQLPAHWTVEANANRAWPYFLHASEGVAAAKGLYWLAIVQSLHLLNGAIYALLFWFTESRV